MDNINNNKAKINNKFHDSQCVEHWLFFLNLIEALQVVILALVFLNDKIKKFIILRNIIFFSNSAYIILCL